MAVKNTVCRAISWSNSRPAAIEWVIKDSHTNIYDVIITSMIYDNLNLNSKLYVICNNQI